MAVSQDLKYTKEHEWVKTEGDLVTVGITDYAKEQLGDIVYVDLPASGDNLEQMKPFGAVESVKAVSDLYAPVSGEVIEINQKAIDNPEIIAEDPYGKGWMIKIKLKDKSEIDNLLSAQDYEKLIS